MKARLNDAAERLTVHINPRLAPGIIAAKLCGYRPAKGMTEYSDAHQVEPSGEAAGGVGAIQLLQPIKGERDVGCPSSQQCVHTTGLLRLLLGRTEFRVVIGRPSHHPAVGERDDARAIGGVEADDNI